MEETSQGKKSSKKILMPIIGLVIVLAATYFAYTKIAYARHNEDTENSQIEANIVPIAPRISGYVDAVFVKENQRINKGDTILKLDDREETKLARTKTLAPNLPRNLGLTPDDKKDLYCFLMVALTDLKNQADLITKGVLDEIDDCSPRLVQ